MSLLTLTNSISGINMSYGLIALLITISFASSFPPCSNYIKFFAFYSLFINNPYQNNSLSLRATSAISL
jgi:hypothetical protein